MNFHVVNPVTVIPAVLRRRGPLPKITLAQVKTEFEAGLSDAAIATKYKCSKQLIYAKRGELGLLRRRGRSLLTKTVQIKTVSRFISKAVLKRAVMPPVDHPAFTEDRTIYPTTVVDVSDKRILISGINSWKIGDRISKGPLKGFPIFTLTLEERATCPSSCKHWRSCYGNHMQLARRNRHGPEFEAALTKEVEALQLKYPGGFAIRLHVLGDFYSVEYVQLWVSFLARFRALFIFGFTARWEKSDPIAVELLKSVDEHWPRMAIRFSNAPVDECSTISVEHPRQVPADAIICPQQIGKTKSCGSCALCWHSKRRIAFLQH